MKVYIVTREWKYRQACSYGDHGTYYETETDVVGAYDTEEKAKKKIENKIINNVVAIRTSV